MAPDRSVLDLTGLAHSATVAMQTGMRGLP